MVVKEPYAQNLRLRKAARAEKQSKVMFWVLIGYFVIEYVRPQYFAPFVGLFRPGLIFGIALIIYSLTKAWWVIEIVLPIRIAIAFVALMIIWVPFATNNFHAFGAMQSMVLHVFAAMIPIIALIRSRERFKVLVRFWIGVGVYLSFFGLTHAGKGPGSFLTDENDLAVFLLMTLPISYFMAQRPGVSIGQRLFLYGATAFMVVGIVSTNSRGGFVGLAAVTTALVWYSKSRLKAILIILVLAASILPFVPDSYIQEITTISDAEDGTRRDRLYSWGLGWEMFLEHPIAGVGPQNYPWRVHEYEQRTALEDRDIKRGHGGRVAHSLYFTLIPELGLIGIAIYGAMVFCVLRVNSRTKKYTTDDYYLAVARSISVSFVGFFSAGIFLSVLYYPNFWYFAAYAIALNRIATKAEDDPHSTAEIK